MTEGPPKKPTTEALQNLEQARAKLSLLWRKDVTPLQLQQSVLARKEDYRRKLIEAGHINTALLYLNRDKEQKEKRSIRKIRFISSNDKKYQAIQEALLDRNIEILKAGEGDSNQRELDHHRLLRKMMQETKDQKEGKAVVPSIRSYEPYFYSVDIAEDKARDFASLYPRDSIFASDVVVLVGNDILEKPKDEQEAIDILKNNSGKEVMISAGVVFITSIPSGETVLFREGLRMQVTLRDYSDEDVREYLRAYKDYTSIAGAIDYASPEAQRFLASKPINIRALRMQDDSLEEIAVDIDRTLLPGIADYCVGMPKEMIQGMVAQVDKD